MDLYRWRGHRCVRRSVFGLLRACRVARLVVPRGRGHPPSSGCPIAASSVATARRKSAENAAADKTRSAAPHIHPPRQAVHPPHLPPPPQHCWLRCWSGAGGPAPAPGPARACATAPSSSSVRSRRSGAPTTIFAKTGPEILIFRKSSCHQGCHRTRSQSTPVSKNRRPCSSAHET